MYIQENTMKEKVITARIDNDVVYQIQYLKNRLGLKNTTSVLVEAIHHLYAQAQIPNPDPFEGLEKAGLIGCIEGKGDSSTTYKETVMQYLEDKYSNHKKKYKKKH